MDGRRTGPIDLGESNNKDNNNNNNNIINDPLLIEKFNFILIMLMKQIKIILQLWLLVLPLIDKGGGKGLKVDKYSL